MAGDIHALILLFILPLSLLIALLCRDSFSIIRAFLIFIPTLLAVGALYPQYNCGVGNNPFIELVLPPIAAGILALFVRRKRIYIPAAILLGVFAFQLAANFHSMVFDREACKYTGDLICISCSCDQPAKGHRLWHTWLTGLYGIEVLPSGQK